MGEGSHSKMESIRRIAVIGAGNVATHLARSLAKHYEIVQIASRHLDNARQLAATINPQCQYTDSISELAQADAYLISVNDDAIAKVLQEVPAEHRKALWMHTSGSVDISVFQGLVSRYGVFYPLQTFSKSVTLDIKEVPIFTEGATSEIEAEMNAIASAISDHVYHADSEIRRTIHISAVYACNFVNHLFSIADRTLSRHDIPFEVLLPLIKETVRKVTKVSPTDAQTGPAARGDKGIIDKHLSVIDNETDRAIYKLLSESIMQNNKQ